jgi:inner membrane protein COX18
MGEMLCYYGPTSMDTKNLRALYGDKQCDEWITAYELSTTPVTGTVGGLNNAQGIVSALGNGEKYNTSTENGARVEVGRFSDATSRLQDEKLLEQKASDGAQEAFNTPLEPLATVLHNIELGDKRQSTDAPRDLLNFEGLENFAHVVMTVPYELFNALHVVIPLWALSIPITTVMIRTSLTALTYHITKKAEARLQSVHAFTAAHKLANKYASRTKEPVTALDASGKPVLIVPRNVHLQSWYNAIKLRYNVSTSSITFWKWANIPVWFATVEALRSMAGTRYGIFGLFCRSVGISISEGDVLFPAWIEPLFKTEGVLWFPDLTVPDPYGVLSIMLGLSMARSIYSSTARLRTPAYIDEGSALRGVWVRALPLAGLVIVPFTLQFPAALLLYWTTSSVAAPVITSLYDKKKANLKSLSAKVKPLTTGLESLSKSQWLIEPTARSRHLGGKPRSGPMGRAPMS